MITYTHTHVDVWLRNCISRRVTLDHQNHINTFARPIYDLTIVFIYTFIRSQSFYWNKYQVYTIFLFFLNVCLGGAWGAFRWQMMEWNHAERRRCRVKGQYRLAASRFGYCRLLLTVNDIKKRRITFPRLVFYYPLACYLLICYGYHISRPCHSISFPHEEKMLKNDA